MTKEGYDKQIYWEDGNQSGSWNPSEENPTITAMSNEKNTKIILVMEDRNAVPGSLGNLRAPKLVELNLVDDSAMILVRGRQSLNSEQTGYSVKDNLASGFLFPSEPSIPPMSPPRIWMVTVYRRGGNFRGHGSESSDKVIVDAVYNYFFDRSGSVARISRLPPSYLSLVLPARVGWIWTNKNTFSPLSCFCRWTVCGLALFQPKFADPIRFYDYSAQRWVTLGE